MVLHAPMESNLMHRNAVIWISPIQYAAYNHNRSTSFQSQTKYRSRKFHRNLPATFFESSCSQTNKYTNGQQTRSQNLRVAELKCTNSNYFRSAGLYFPENSPGWAESPEDLPKENVGNCEIFYRPDAAMWSETVGLRTRPVSDKKNRSWSCRSDVVL